MKTALAKLTVAVMFSLVFAVACSAQKTCDLASKAAPLFLNLRIGITPEQAQTFLGKDLNIKIKKKGERTFFQNYIKKPAPASISGVRALYLRFFDRRLYQIEIFYEPQINLATLKNITDKLSAQFILPASDWTIKNNRAETICGEVSLIADNVLNPRIELTDETTRTLVEEKRKKDEKD